MQAPGLTPNELAKLLRISPDKVRAWITAGELPAVNVADAKCGRPRYIILPHHLAEWEQRRAAAKPRRTRKKRTTKVDYYPD
jgi:excisionase family DNA binding protein